MLNKHVAINSANIKCLLTHFWRNFSEALKHVTNWSAYHNLFKHGLGYLNFFGSSIKKEALFNSRIPSSTC